MVPVAGGLKPPIIFELLLKQKEILARFEEEEDCNDDINNVM